MAISPMDIHHKEFSTVRVGGYNKEEVDAFLDMVADELDRLLHRNQEQAELVESMRQKAAQFDNMQTTLQNALINAQKSADSIVQEAQAQAEAQLKEAAQHRERMLEEARSEKERIYQSYAGIRDQVLRYIATIRELLDKNQDLVREYESRLTAAELKEPVGPTVTPPMTEPSFAQPVKPEEPSVGVETGLGAAASPVFKETTQATAEAAPAPQQVEEPPFTVSGEPGPAEFKPIVQEAAAPMFSAVEKPMQEPPTMGMEVGQRTVYAEQPTPIVEQPPLAMEQPPPIVEQPPPVVEQPPPAVEQPSGPAFTPEQEMEMLRESQQLEKEPPVTQPPEKPGEEAAGEEEKHFFWE